MKTYIAGPMRGYPDYNFQAFHDAVKVLREAGHEVISPAEMDEEIYGTQEQIREAVAKPGSFIELMHRDLAAVLECEAVALLPGWHESKGALLEAFVASYTGVKVFEYVGSGVHGGAISLYKILLAIAEHITEPEKPKPVIEKGN